MRKAQSVLLNAGGRCLFAGVASGDSDKGVVKAVAEKLKNMFALVAGLDIFAERVGLSRERLLSFSTVLDSTFFEYFLLTPEEMTDETLELAKEHCAGMERLWEQQAGHSPFTVAA